MAEREVLVSTDSAGVFGTPKLWEDLWGFALERSGGPISGFEAIGWSWLERFLGEAGRKKES